MKTRTRHILILVLFAVMLCVTMPTVAEEAITEDQNQQLDEIQQRIAIESAEIMAALDSFEDYLEMLSIYGPDVFYEALARQFEHEAQKHETRKARLAEMRRAAEEKGDDKAVERIQMLIDREQNRYDEKYARMTEKAGRLD